MVTFFPFILGFFGFFSIFFRNFSAFPLADILLDKQHKKDN